MSDDALNRWQKTAAKLTTSEKDRIVQIVSDLESCLKFTGGRIYLGIEAKSVLALHLYDPCPELERL